MPTKQLGHRRLVPTSAVSDQFGFRFLFHAVGLAINTPNLPLRSSVALGTSQISGVMVTLNPSADAASIALPWPEIRSTLSARAGSRARYAGTEVAGRHS